MSRPKWQKKALKQALRRRDKFNTLMATLLLKVNEKTVHNWAIVDLSNRNRNAKAWHPERPITGKTRYLVGLARCWQQYGGHEEGGWYYQCGEPIGRSYSFYREDRAYDLQARMLRGIPKGKRFPGIGMGGAGDSYDLIPGEFCGNEGIEVVVLSTLNPTGGLEYWPKERPHFE